MTGLLFGPGGGIILQRPGVGPEGLTVARPGATARTARATAATTLRAESMVLRCWVGFVRAGVSAFAA
eukprot:CAMPEP_0198334466 /NCGR_PEP_ID=MMETSP1450-20131203/19631_1 /TAXON_ID=753684 ORGANISM="Madagascaria erythrocladiodes, Strain CCMP3234" /NCGR_SAMPLE_ID=MMETSP1450 /ASSEMBLY_ACC=CAM_ASM_001115 /LENGTH=67 /DNA_ID=CAMNT_0044039059 /DNA_START=345 /DNA_END=548 /DNA_ORIENTATION=-